MKTNEHLKAGHEKATVDRFVKEYFNRKRNCNFSFKAQPDPPKPDLVYCDQEKRETIGIEVTDAYYSESDAKGTWDIARGKTRHSSSAFHVNPDEQLAQFINNRIKTKCDKAYDFNHSIILLVVTGPALTENKQDFQGNILPHIKLPDHIPFSDIYLDVSFHSYHQYYPLYQSKDKTSA